jgi:hypothetical protein
MFTLSGVGLAQQFLGRMPAVPFPHPEMGPVRGSGQQNAPPVGAGHLVGVGVTGGRCPECRPIERRPALGLYRRGPTRERANDQHRRHAEAILTKRGGRSVRTARPNRRAGLVVGGRVSAGSRTGRRDPSPMYRRTAGSRFSRSSGPPPDGDNKHDGENNPDGVGPRCHGLAGSDIAGGRHHCATAKPRRTRTATAAPRRPAESGRALPPCSRNVTPRTGAPGRQIPQA